MSRGRGSKWIENGDLLLDDIVNLGNVFLYPYYAWRYGYSKIKKSFARINRREEQNRDIARIGLASVGALIGGSCGIYYGVLAGMLLASILSPGFGTAFFLISFAVIFSISGGVAGTCLGLGVGAWAAKLATKVGTGLDYFIKRWTGRYVKEKVSPANYPVSAQYPPVKYSNQSKYMPNASFLRKKETGDVYVNVTTSQEYSMRDVWKIMKVLKQEKANNKKRYDGFFFRIFPKWSAERYKKEIALNKEFNTAIKNVRRLELERNKPTELSTVSLPPEELLENLEDKRPLYYLQFGSFYYSVRDAGPDETLEQMSSEKPDMIPKPLGVSP